MRELDPGPRTPSRSPRRALFVLLALLSCGARAVGAPAADGVEHAADAAADLGELLRQNAPVISRRIDRRAPGHLFLVGGAGAVILMAPSPFCAPPGGATSSRGARCLRRAKARRVLLCS